MSRFLPSVVLLVSCSWLSSCVDQRLDRPNEEAMMIYRECMAGMPGAVTSAGMSSAISNSASANKGTSIAANARTRQEQDQEIFCMQQAGWKN